MGEILKKLKRKKGQTRSSIQHKHRDQYEDGDIALARQPTSQTSQDRIFLQNYTRKGKYYIRTTSISKKIMQGS